MLGHKNVGKKRRMGERNKDDELRRGKGRLHAMNARKKCAKEFFREKKYIEIWRLREKGNQYEEKTMQ